HAQANEPAEQQVVFQLLHQQPLAAHGVEDLQEQRPQQLLGRNRGPSRARIQLAEPPRHLLQRLVGHFKDRPQWVILRDSCLRRDVTEHRCLSYVTTSHQPPSAESRMKTWMFYSLTTPRERGFSAPC